MGGGYILGAGGLKARRCQGTIWLPGANCKHGWLNAAIGAFIPARERVPNLSRGRLLPGGMRAPAVRGVRAALAAGARSDRRGQALIREDRGDGGSSG